MRGLAQKRPIFHSEADFQHALAWYIRETVPDSEIRLEWNPFVDENLHSDIWIPSHGIVMELKYPATEPLDVVHRDERYVMKKYYPVQSRYDFVKDVSRVERVLIERQDASAGFAILLSNNSPLWKVPQSDWQNRDDAAFRLHERRSLRGTLRWKPGSSHLKTKTRRDPICLRRTYSIGWNDYWNFECGGKSLLRYLAVEVRK